jgi:3-deoxy-manno-octulosonate cytidylyltransferase (CMP-KDO synthetase)
LETEVNNILVIGVIPARIGSTRFPRKILADIEGKPMIAHVAERALEAEMLDKVVIAIDSEETEKALSSYKFDLIMTDIGHESGTDRVAEVAKTIDEAEIIINIQGDEPLLNPKVIDNLVRLFDDPIVSMGTVVSRSIGVKDYLDRNIVKVFLDENQNAYNFKRDIYDAEIGGVFRHVGFYGFQRETLFEYSSLPPSKNEIDNSLEQFRALDNGIKIRALITNSEQLAVDVPEDIDRVVSRIKKLSKTL